MSVSVHQDAAPLVVSGQRYLLFGGREPTVGGVADLMAVFDSQPEARHTFADLRRYRANETTWAELCEVDSAGRVRILSSFGRGRPARWTADLPLSGRPSRLAEGRRARRRFFAGVSRASRAHSPAGT